MSMRIEKEVCTWGDCQFGQLGNGADAMKAFEVPVVVHSLNSKDVIGIAAGKDHVLAVLGDGTIASWGRGDVGQLGQGDITTCATPRILHALDAVVVTTVVASDGVSACITDDGAVYQWGRMLKAAPDGTSLCCPVHSPQRNHGLAGMPVHPSPPPPARRFLISPYVAQASLCVTSVSVQITQAPLLTLPTCSCGAQASPAPSAWETTSTTLSP
jgi:hypothetical protein